MRIVNTMELTKRQWYATYLVAAFFGIVMGSTLLAPKLASAAGKHVWITQIYLFEEKYIVLIAAVVLIALTVFAIKKKFVGPSGWPLYFGIGCCIGRILYGN